MQHTEADRYWAARHVAEGDRRIELQQALIDESRAKGFPTRLSEDVLTTMERTLDNMREHLAQIELALAGGR